MKGYVRVHVMIHAEVNDEVKLKVKVGEHMAGRFDKLTDKQEMFCQHYVASNNGAESAGKAGYTGNNLAVQASRLLTQDKIQNRVNELRKVALEKVEAEQIDVMRLLSNIAREENDHKYNVNARLKALELIGKAQGIFIDKKEIKSESTVNVNDASQVSDDELDELLKQYDNVIDFKDIQ